MSIVFNGQSLVAHLNEADTPYLLVSFIGFYHEHEADQRYFLKSIIEREEISCVGITSRIRNLYLTDEINQIAELVRTLRRPGQKIIMIGQSSGGYAALKHAALFGADYVVAFSPLFSADATDLGLTEDREHDLQVLKTAIRIHRLLPEFIRTGMRPGPEDCPVPAIIIHDLHDYADSRAASRYEQTLPTVRFVRSKNLGHAVANRMDDHLSLTPLLVSLVEDNLDGAVRILSRLARFNEDAVAELMVQIARWRPSMLPIALRTPRAMQALKPETRSKHHFNTVLAYNLARQSNMPDAVRHLQTMHPQLFPTQPGNIPNAESGLFLVLSYHGQFLGYDNKNNRPAFASDTLHSQNGVPVLLDVRETQPRFVIPTRGGERAVTLRQDNLETKGDPFEIVPVSGSGMVSFCRGGLFLRTDVNSNPRFSATDAQAWEQFAIIPVLDASAFRKHASVGWFDQATLNTSDSQADAPEPTPRKGAFRSALRRLFAA